MASRLLSTGLIPDRGGGERDAALTGMFRNRVAASKGKAAMGKGFLARPWVQQFIVVFGYALIHTCLARIFLDAAWPLTASLRFTCLLLLPYRYWSALALSEFVSLTYHNTVYLDDYGRLYTATASLPPIILGMPIVYWFRHRAALFPTPQLVDVKKLLGCVLALAMLWASERYVLLFSVQLPAGAYRVPEGTFFLFLINFYMAILTIAPWVVMFRIYHLNHAWRLPMLRMLIVPPFAQDVMVAVLTIIGLACLHQFSTPLVKPALMMALFLPAAWLALKHGWRAAAVGGTLSLITTCLLLKWRPELAILEAQAFMAFAMTCLYTFGAQISSQRRLYEQVKNDSRQVQKVAQGALVSSELRLQHTSQALECVADILRLDHKHVLDCYVPEQERHGYSEQAHELEPSVYRMAENIHPSAWRERGIGAAFYETIGQTLREAGIDYACEIPWRNLRFLSHALQAALYRTACETIALISTSPACGSVHLSIRTGRRHGVRWVALRVESKLDNDGVAKAVLHTTERQRVAPKLGATLSTMVCIFDGKLRTRTLMDGMRVSALLCDATEQPQELFEQAKPMRLWVT
jgi:hypothetical protein